MSQVIVFSSYYIWETSLHEASLSAEGTKSTSFHTQCVWNEVDLVPFACDDVYKRPEQLPSVVSYQIYGQISFTHLHTLYM